MVPASGQSTHLHRTLSGPNSPSHMPTQAVTNPLKLVSPRRRPTDCGRVRIRCTICSNTRGTFAFTVVAMVSALVSEHEARPSPSYSQTNARCSQCCTVCGIFGAANPAFPLLAGILCTLWCLQAANRPTCTALYPVQIARAICRLKLSPIHSSSSALGDDQLIVAECALGAPYVAILEAPLHLLLLLWSQPWLVSTRQGLHRLTAKLMPDAASVALCVGYLVQLTLLFHCLLAYSARYGACKRPIDPPAPHFIRSK